MLGFFEKNTQSGQVNTKFSINSEPEDNINIEALEAEADRLLEEAKTAGSQISDAIEIIQQLDGLVAQLMDIQTNLTDMNPTDVRRKKLEALFVKFGLVEIKSSDKEAPAPASSKPRFG